MERKWRAVETWLARLPWYVKALSAIFGAVSLITGLTVAQVVQSTLNYDIPSWIPEFVDSGLASVVLVIVGVVIFIALHASRHFPTKGNGRPAESLPKSPSPGSSGRTKTRTTMWTEVDEQGEEHEHATVEPDVIGTGVNIPGKKPGGAVDRKESLPNWVASHRWIDPDEEPGHSLPTPRGYGVILAVESTDGEERPVHFCKIMKDEQELGTYDETKQGSKFYSPSVQPTSEKVLSYPTPTMFFGSPEELTDGTYQVEWRALAGAGSVLLDTDEFEIVGGELAKASSSPSGTPDSEKKRLPPEIAHELGKVSTDILRWVGEKAQIGQYMGSRGHYETVVMNDFMTRYGVRVAHLLQESQDRGADISEVQQLLKDAQDIGGIRLLALRLGVLARKLS